MDTKEVVQAVEHILREKKIERARLGEIVESLFFNMLKKKYKVELEDIEKYFSVTFNIDNGDVEIMHEREVVSDEKFTDSLSQISLEDALKIDEDVEMGEILPEIVDFSEFGRRHVIAGKQILAQKIRKVEKEKVYDKFKHRIGEIIYGTIHQVTPREIKINIRDSETDVELIMPRREAVFNERYRRGEGIKTFIKDVQFKNQDVQILVSRADEGFIRKLFELEVPEISDGVINIVKVGRIPGIRTKIVLETYDSRVDPVGACVGQRGSRISSIVSELNKEKIDIIHYVGEPRTYITKLLGIKTEVSINIDELENIIDIIVPDEKIREIRGYKSANVRLAQEISGYNINLFSETEYDSENDVLIEDVEEISEEIKTLLIDNKFITGEDVFNPRRMDELEAIEGLKKEDIEKVKLILDEYYE